MKVQDEIKQLKDPKKAVILQRFFKTGPGEYGEGDIFYGLTAPQTRVIAKAHRDLSLIEIKKLLRSPIHEERVVALFILALQYQKGDDKLRGKLHGFYMKNLKWVNNWDLVDLSAPLLVGHWLSERNRGILYKLAKSKNLWQRRVAILGTFHFIRQNDFQDALKISEILLKDEHDLIHKAVGWMLREVGKRDVTALTRFLNKHAIRMPRTMLRYAIEKFPEKKRQYYLKLK